MFSALASMGISALRFAFFVPGASLVLSRTTFRIG